MNSVLKLVGNSFLYWVALLVCNKLLLTNLVFPLPARFGEEAELLSKNQQKFVADHQCRPVLSGGGLVLHRRRAR